VTADGRAVASLSHDVRLAGSGVYPVIEESTLAALVDRITVNPDQCGGRTCVRGLRIRVTDVLDLPASGLSPEQVLEELPDLEVEDISACLRFASRRH
jgi:uncharacterized protein (DUF433 family)